jgi:hypothetical protein
MLTPQEINEKLATEIMSWHKDQDGRIWLDSNNESTGFVSYHLCDNDEVFGPTYDANHAFLVLHKWLEEHPKYRYRLGYANKDNILECLLFLPDNWGTKPFVGSAQENHESQAICNCLMQATSNDL